MDENLHVLMLTIFWHHYNLQLVKALHNIRLLTVDFASVSVLGFRRDKFLW